MKKTLSFAVLHFTVAFTLAYVLTGDAIIGSLIAMAEPMVNTVAFFFHDKAWRIRKLSQLAHQSPTKKTMSFAIVHFSVAFLVTFLLTGDALIGGLMATIEPMINTFVFHFHERFWLRRERDEFTVFCHHHELKEHSKEIAESSLTNTENTKIKNGI